MLSQPHSDHHLQQPQEQAPRLQPYLTTQLNGHHYRVLTRQLLCNRALVRIWAVFWSFSTLTLSLLILCSLQQTGVVNILSQPLPLLVLATVASLMQTLFCYLQRSNLNKSCIHWSMASLCLSLALTSFVAGNIPLTVLPCFSFSMVLLVLASKQIKRMGKMILLVLVLAQITLIAMKADGWLSVSWQMVLLPVIPTTFLSLSSLIFLLIYCYFLSKRDPLTFQTRKYTLVFLVFSLLGLTTTQLVVLAYIYLMLSLTGVAAVAMVFTFAVATVLGLFCHQIALSFCRYKEALADDKPVKVTLNKDENRSERWIWRYSSDWFGMLPKGNNQKGSSQQSKEGYPECLICTQAPSQMVWFPCGHLSLCPPCAQDMLDANMVSCVLCKQKPQHICKLVSEEQEKESEQYRQVERQMGLNIESGPSSLEKKVSSQGKDQTGHKKYEVSEWYSVNTSFAL